MSEIMGFEPWPLSDQDLKKASEGSFTNIGQLESHLHVQLMK